MTPSIARDEQWFAFASTTRPSDEPYTAALQATFALLGVADDVVSTVDSLSAQKALVRLGLGLALLPTSAVRDARYGAARGAAALGPAPAAPIRSVRRRNSPPPPPHELAAVLADYRR